jgi:hypothetical protein
MAVATIEIRPRKQFREFIETTKRWCCLVVHRRGGKTYASLQKLLLRALNHKRPGPPKRYAYIAPTQAQAKDIAWGYLKSFTSRIPGVETNESDLKITFPDGMIIRLYSGDNYERMRGLYFDGVVIDEPEDINPDAWPSVIRPCLSDYEGWALWIGTIKGKLGQWQRYLDACKDPDWFALLLRASESGIIPAEELADLKKSIHPDIYAQEYECDSRVSRCAFTTDALNLQDTFVGIRPSEFGYFSNTGTDEEPRIIWNPSSEGQAMSVRWEQPRVGCRYLVSVDSASGADQTGGEDPDSHSILVHRAGYIAAETGQWIPPAIVARNMMVPANKPGMLCCWWAEDVLEDQVFMLCKAYNAFLVPEVNHDRGLIEAMKRRGITIYEREQFNHRDNMTMKALGWKTDADTRPRIIARLEVITRETLRGDIGGGYEIRCPWILEQMRNFGTKANGRMEALSGHDDDVLSLAIGSFLIDAATPYHEQMRERWLPADIRNSRSVPSGRGKNTFS